MRTKCERYNDWQRKLTAARREREWREGLESHHQIFYGSVRGERLSAGFLREVFFLPERK